MSVQFFIVISSSSGILVPGGFGERGIEGMIAAALKDFSGRKLGVLIPHQDGQIYETVN